MLYFGGFGDSFAEDFEFDVTEGCVQRDGHGLRCERAWFVTSAVSVVVDVICTCVRVWLTDNWEAPL